MLRRAMKSGRKLSPYITTGRIGSSKVVHVSSGIGIANASHAATVLIERFGPSRIVVFGIGGAYPGSRLQVGEVVLAEREVYADAGVLLKDGMRGMEEIGIEFLKKGPRRYFNEFPLDTRLLKRALRSLRGLRTGVFATVNASTGTLGRAREIRRRTGAICENMEGAAVAHICARYGMPVAELRGISNEVSLRDTAKWNKEAASENCQRALIVLMEEAL